MTHPYFGGAGEPRILAHRGLVTADAAAQGIVENSFAAVAAAHAAGIAYVESDCHLTSDGTVVLFHDADLRRITGDPRPIDQVPLGELEGIMADRGGLITLAQALDSFPDTRFNIDVKAEDAAVPAGRIVAAYAERVLLTSFSLRRRRAALGAAASARARLLPATSGSLSDVARVLFALSSGSARLVDRALKGIDALQVPERHGMIKVVTPRLIRAAHRAHVEVHVWTVNEPADMIRLVELGVDGIVTDRADLALTTFAHRRD